MHILLILVHWSSIFILRVMLVYLESTYVGTVFYGILAGCSSKISRAENHFFSFFILWKGLPLLNSCCRRWKENILHVEHLLIPIAQFKKENILQRYTENILYSIWQVNDRTCMFIRHFGIDRLYPLFLCHSSTIVPHWQLCIPQRPNLHLRHCVIDRLCFISVLHRTDCPNTVIPRSLIAWS